MTTALDGSQQLDSSLPILLLHSIITHGEDILDIFKIRSENIAIGRVFYDQSLKLFFAEIFEFRVAELVSGFSKKGLMASRMKKGLLKPLRYLSHMFDGKERELQIGHPTDVEHVAHIGWDGPKVNGPSWMREFHSAPLSATSFGEEGREKPITNLWASQEIHSHERLEGDSIQETPRYATVEFDGCSPPNVITVGDREPSDSPRRGQRHYKKVGPTNASSSEETSIAGKRSHRRRSKGSQERGTSNRRSRLKDSTSCHGESECCIRANPNAEANCPSE